MIHDIIIWSKDKDSGKNHLIKGHIQVTEEDLLEFVINKYKEDMSGYLSDDKEYYAELNETRH